MKKIVSILGCILFALVILQPVGVVLSSCAGYTFELVSDSAFVIITALLSLCTVVLSIAAKETAENSLVRVLFSLLTPVSLINAVFYLSDFGNIWICGSVLICIGCCCFLTIKHGKPSWLKTAALLVSAFLVLPICFFGFIGLTFGNTAHNTVVRSVDSPNGAYYAEVIDSDQGVLGGNTLVDVYENKGINALVFKISKKPQRVYHGKWGEFESMEIYWKDNNCLVINDVEYQIEW